MDKFSRAMAAKIQDDKTYENIEEYGGNFIIPQDHGKIYKLTNTFALCYWNSPKKEKGLPF